MADPGTDIARREITLIAPVTHRSFGAATRVRQTWAIASHSFREIAFGWGGIVLVALTLPTLAYAEIKRLFLNAGAAHFEAQLEDEALTLARIAGSADAQEGIAAMVERRKPNFTGH